MPNFDELAKAIENASKHESIVTQILTLAVEYKAKSITAQRFADRVSEILAEAYKRSPAASRSDSDGK